MTVEISGFGSGVFLVATETFPAGITLSQWPDDTDPLVVEQDDFGSATKGVNGELLRNLVANPISVTLSLIPGSLDEDNLQTLANANRPGKNKSIPYDVITLTEFDAQGNSFTYNNGIIVSGNAGFSVSSNSRKSTNTWGFLFENVTRSVVSVAS